MSNRHHIRAGKPSAATLRVVVLPLILLLVAVLLGACGSGDSGTDPGNAADAPDFKPALAKAPSELKPLYDQGGDLAPGGIDAFESQLEQVKGYPVVVNNWASWCGPCRTEWPWFQQAAADHLDRVAFIGVDGDDEDSTAQTFLDEHPIPYPSFADPDKELANRVGANLIGAFPNTLFFNAEGELVYAHQGEYADQAALEADIQKYALE
jgi:cytochrome c biogenesis protein CcmG, thiol:disulfide interchange protein DsbE